MPLPLIPVIAAGSGLFAGFSLGGGLSNLWKLLAAIGALYFLLTRG